MSLVQRSQLNFRATVLARLTLLVAGTVAAGSALAQTTSIVRIGAPAAVLEGNAGTRVMRFPILLDAPASTEIRGRFVTKQGTLSDHATQGTTCAGLTDFLAVDQTFAIPVGTLSTSVDVLVCGDTRQEPAIERVQVTLSTVFFPAQCANNSCAGAGVITEDDIPGTLAIDGVSVGRSSFFSRRIQVPIRLTYPFGVPVTVRYRTSDVTARGIPSCTGQGLFLGDDYETESGTVTFLPGQTSATAAVLVCASLSSSEETLRVTLTEPLAPITIFRNRATVTLLPASDGRVGVFTFGPDEARIPADEPVPLSLEWTMPPGKVWRDLNHIGMRLHSNKKTLLWVNWSESSNLFSLCQRQGVRHGPYDIYGSGSEVALDEDEGDESQTLAVSCSAGALPGSDTVLETRYARVHLKDTQVVGSGPTGDSVRLRMSISLKPSVRGKATVELAASDDSGQVDSFVQAAQWKLVRHQDD